MTDSFYRAFEEKYRGSRELIKSRLTVYHPFLESVLSIYPEARALDLGCGRGEWLEYVRELGFSGIGVDLDEGMLASCNELGLAVEKNDLLKCLSHTESESVVLVSAFHVVEHISFHDLRFLIQEAMRVLKPGGLLIMETPNPENIIVATRSFYLDPTHEKPIPSELLAFVAEFSGFKRVKTVRLQEAKALVDKDNINIVDLLSGVSPDYAIVAQKQAEPEIMAKFDEAFAREYGLSQNVLAARFDDRLSWIEAKAIEAEARASEAHAKAIEAEVRASEADAKASEAEAKVIEVAIHLDAILNSRSWRITSPMRWCGFQLNLLRARGFKQRFQDGILRALSIASWYLEKHPNLKRVVLRTLQYLGITRIISDMRISQRSSNPYVFNDEEVQVLSKRARYIFSRLKDTGI